MKTVNVFHPDCNFGIHPINDLDEKGVKFFEYYKTPADILIVEYTVSQSAQCVERGGNVLSLPD